MKAVRATQSHTRRFRKFGGAATETPNRLKEGQVRCPVCRNGTATRKLGHLRQHRDLFGNICYNRSPGDES